MELAIRGVDCKNYEEIINFKVSKEQIDFIESVKDCLDEAKENKEWQCVGIYDKDKVVGFAMYGFISEENRVWFDRYLISYEYQGKGYGEAGVRLIINHLYNLYGHKKIYLSVYANNLGAISLYKKIGFKFNGEYDVNGEDVMEIDFLEMENINDK